MDADDSRASSFHRKRPREESAPPEDLEITDLGTPPPPEPQLDEEDGYVALGVDSDAESGSNSGSSAMGEAGEEVDQDQEDEPEPLMYQNQEPAVSAAPSQVVEVPEDKRQLLSWKRAQIERIFSTEASSTDMATLVNNPSAYLIAAGRPQLATGKKPGKSAPRKTVRQDLWRYIGQVAADGIAEIFFFPKVGPSQHVNYLVRYENEAAAELALTGIEENPCVLAGMPVGLKISKLSESHLVSNWRKITRLNSEAGWFATARSKALGVCNPLSKKQRRKLRSAPLDMVASTQLNANGLVPPSLRIPSGSQRTEIAIASDDDEGEANQAASGETSLNQQAALDPVHNGKSRPDTSEKTPVIVDLTVSEDEDSHMPDAHPAIDPAGTQRRVCISELTKAERKLQARYWRIVKDADAVRCNVCTEPGHMAETCPARTCKHCNAVDRHFSKACPTMRKCTRCRERGHRAQQCPSKLARSTADGFFCDLCSQPGHVEEECARLWRTFDPAKKACLNKVASVVVSCYSCGSNTHWGDDCNVMPKPKLVNTNNTFSAQEANRYLITPMAATTRQGFSIRGRAEQANAGAESEDDDGSRFYGKKVKPAKPPGGIRIKAAAATSIEKPTHRGFPPPDYGSSRRGNDHRSQEAYPDRRSRSPRRRTPTLTDYQDRNAPGNYRYDRYSGWQPPLPDEPLPSYHRPVRGRGRGRASRARR